MTITARSRRSTVTGVEVPRHSPLASRLAPLEVAREQDRGRARVIGAGPGELGREALVERLDGDVDVRAQLGEELLGLARLLADVARERQRQADDDPLRLLVADEPTSRSRPAPLPARSTTSSGRATVPVGSETATPVRADP